MNAVKCRKAIAACLALALLSSAALTACGGTLEVGIERTPTPDRAATATVSALATENARLAAQVATLTVPTATPTPELGKLAYVQGGDIWVKALPDGEPQRLTADGRNRQPRWSPSGQWLAFRKGEYQVWVMRTDGSAARPLNERIAVSAFAWSPTGDRLAYVVSESELWVSNADGTEPVNLEPPGPSYRITGLAWSPDGNWIAYGLQGSLAPAGGPKPPDRYAGLWRMQADGSHAAELFGGKVVFGVATPPPGTSPYGGAIVADWSPDGQHILFWSDPFSASLLADGTSLKAIPAGGGALTEVVSYMLAYPDFLAPSPDGRFLAAIEGAGREAWTHKHLARVHLPGGGLTYLTDDKTAASSPAWSPSGERIVYVAMPDLGEEHLAGGEPVRRALMQRRLWVVNAQNERRRALTHDPAYRDERPLWSADGSHILFARMDSEDRASLWLIPAEGGQPQQVVEELTPAPGWFGYYGHVEWGELFDWWTGPTKARVAVHVPTPAPTVTPGLPATATPMATAFPVATRPLPTPTLGPTRTHTDAVLGIALEVPADWEVDSIPGAATHFSVRDAKGTRLPVLTFSVLNPESRTLELALSEVERGAWGPYLRAAEPARLGSFEALRITLMPGEDRPSVFWVLVAPSGRAVGFIPYGDVALLESVLTTLRAVPVREPPGIVTATPSTSSDLESAREALTAFFSLLHARRYSEAINYYGGIYDVLKDWNPTVAQDDYATLFRNGCMINGLMCLRIKTIVREEEVSPTEFRFVVEFMNDDGTLFVRGPCCGATEKEMPLQSQFAYTVKKVEGKFLVQELPVLVP